MKTILQNPSTRIWFLSGLTGMVLMAGLLLGEGQARTYPPSPTHAPLSVTIMDHPIGSSQAITLKRSEINKAISEQKPHQKTMGKRLGVNVPEKKKRMGLAMLFLGILAEEG